MKKIAFVVQRYGAEINGGAELECRAYAQRLAQKYDVTVLTSCAEDYMTWKNHYPAGESELCGVRVLRFPVNKPRVYKKFEKIADRAHADTNIYENGIEWQWAQGPHCPGLLHHLSAFKQEYAAILFMTYIYSTTYFGIHIAPEHSILIPTAHDETPIYLNIFTSEFHLPKHILFNTQAEREFVQNKFHNAHIPSDVVGLGVELPEGVVPTDPAERFGLAGDYFVYVGRVADSKNCPELLDWFLKWREQSGAGVRLVLAGKQDIALPRHPAILAPGYVSEADKLGLVQNARALVLPSRYESLSLVTLEAMLQGTPVLVNAECEVLRRHCEESGGGFAYTGFEDFCTRASGLLGDDALRSELGRNGRRYVQQHYQWGSIMQTVEAAIERVAAL